jgi:hypothetical protein
MLRFDIHYNLILLLPNSLIADDCVHGPEDTSTIGASS